MRINIISNSDMPDIVNNAYAFEYLRTLVREELYQIDTLTSLINDKLDDGEYVKKALTIYEVEFDLAEMEIIRKFHVVPNFDKKVIAQTKDRLKGDRDALIKRLKERLEYLKRWSIESSKLTRERLQVEEQVAGYCDSVLDGFDKRK